MTRRVFLVGFRFLQRPLLFIAMLAALFTSCQKRGGGPVSPGVIPGDRMPAFELVTTDDETASSLSLGWRPSVIVFFNTWCPDCHEVLPIIQKWMDEDDTGTQFLCVARGQTNDEVASFWEECGYSMMCAGDPDKMVYNVFTGDNGYGVPVVYFFNDEGVCIKRILQWDEFERP